MEGEVAFDDGDAGSGGHGAGVLALGRGEVAQDRVVAGGLLVVAEVGGGEGQGVVAAGDDGDVVATEDHRDDRDGGVTPIAVLGIFSRKPSNTLPSGSKCQLNCSVQSLADFKNERPECVTITFSYFEFTLKSAATSL